MSSFDEGAIDIRSSFFSSRNLDHTLNKATSYQLPTLVLSSMVVHSSVETAAFVVETSRVAIKMSIKSDADELQALLATTVAAKQWEIEPLAQSRSKAVQDPIDPSSLLQVSLPTVALVEMKCLCFRRIGVDTGSKGPSSSDLSSGTKQNST
jgi:hypothetical protein